ncbi:MAG: hypothetical protein JWP27_2559 [Flaviaesturariibacter sp.]|nr:hypothetical protein [Flaviaesturariibacter sp.]
MKRILLTFGLAAVLSTLVSSCATYKRDCQGGRHTRLSNGVVI